LRKPQKRKMIKARINQHKKPHLVCILGQTSSGKTAMGLDLASFLEVEMQWKTWIIGCDSRQIYHGLDLGTGKIEGKWQQVYNIYKKDQMETEALLRIGQQPFSAYVYKNIKHYLIDYVDPRYRFTLGDYIEDFCSLVELSKELPFQDQPDALIMVGGTGLYAAAILENYDLDRIDPHYTDQFIQHQKWLGSLTLEELQQKLNRQDFNESDWKNPRRLVSRLLKIEAKSNKWVQKFDYPQFESKSAYVIDIDQKLLKDNIKERIEERISIGMADEIKAALKKYGYERCSELGMQYSLMVLKDTGKITEQEWFDRVILSEIQYARRQDTWLKKQKNLIKVKTLADLQKHFLNSLF
jgi:tRNA dimethylallyltransferase